MPSAAPELVHLRLPYGDLPLEAGAPVLTRAYDELALIAALQGIVNREAPRLYLLGVSGHGTADLDQFWWERMADMGWEVARRTPTEARGLEELLAWFGGCARGLVVWDPRVPATLNVAATVAGAGDLLPVAWRPEDGSLYRELVAAGWRAEVALVGPDGQSRFTGEGRIPDTDLPSTGSAKNDAYLWAKTHYLDRGRCSPRHLAYYLDADWLRCPSASPSFWNNTLVNHDYFVAERAFFCDLDPWLDEAPVDDPHQRPGTDGQTLRGILAALHQAVGGREMIQAGGFPPWAFKYTNHGGAGGHHDPVPTEWHFAELLSSYNAFMEADALGLSAIANASFTRHFPLAERYRQAPPPDAATLVARGLVAEDGTVVPARYLAFYVGDYDAPAWLYQAMPAIWRDPKRGQVPLSWAFNPNLCLRAAPAMAWTRATASPLDVFVAGDSGAGYVNPSALEEPRASGLADGVAAWRAHCVRFYRQWDLAVTGFVIDGDARPMGPRALAAYQEFSPGGIVGHKLSGPGLIGEMPLLPMTRDIDGPPARAVEAILDIFLPSDEPQFSVVRAILQQPSWFAEIAAGLGAAEAPVQVVDLPTLLALVRIWVRDRQALPPAKAPAALRIDGDRLHLAGLRPVGAADGRTRLGQVAGRSALWVGGAPGGPTGYLYLRVDTPWRHQFQAGQDVWLEVTCLAASGGGEARCEYNAVGSPYRHTDPQPAAGSAVLRWRLAQVDFRGAQNGGADLRLVLPAGCGVIAVRLEAVTTGA